MQNALRTIFDRYTTYLNAFGPDENYLRKKVEQELGTKMIHLKMRCSGLGSEWGKVSYIFHSLPPIYLIVFWFQNFIINGLWLPVGASVLTAIAGLQIVWLLPSWMAPSSFVLKISCFLKSWKIMTYWNIFSTKHYARTHTLSNSHSSIGWKLKFIWILPKLWGIHMI